MRIYRGNTFAKIYKESLMDLIQNPEYVLCPRGLKIKENTNVTLILENPLSSLFQNEIRSSQKKYISAELLWYFNARRDVEFISKFAKFWETIQNEDGSVNSSYGYLLFGKKNRFGKTQYAWALDTLYKDLDSRQAVMHFNLPEHQYDTNKDFVCTMYGIFQVRDNKLNFTISMRSNDVVWGLPTDIAFFAVLQSQMLSHLKLKYPALELGTYTHIVNSYHIYERHFNTIRDMLQFDFGAEEIPAVKDNLITPGGTTTSNFKLLSSNYKDSPDNFRDPLYNWIAKNIN